MWRGRCRFAADGAAEKRREESGKRGGGGRVYGWLHLLEG